MTDVPMIQKYCPDILPKVTVFDRTGRKKQNSKPLDKQKAVKTTKLLSFPVLTSNI